MKNAMAEQNATPPTRSGRGWRGRRKFVVSTTSCFSSGSLRLLSAGVDGSVTYIGVNNVFE
jgi:hypothetical protein